MTGPVVPPGGEELQEALAEAAVPVLWERDRVQFDLPDTHGHLAAWAAGSRPDRLALADALLPTVLAFADAQGRRRAAEELRAAADSLTDRVRTWVLNLLRDRAAALAPENARPE